MDAMSMLFNRYSSVARWTLWACYLIKDLMLPDGLSEHVVYRVPVCCQMNSLSMLFNEYLSVARWTLWGCCLASTFLVARWTFWVCFTTNSCLLPDGLPEYVLQRIPVCCQMDFLSMFYKEYLSVASWTPWACFTTNTCLLPDGLPEHVLQRIPKLWLHSGRHRDPAGHSQGAVEASRDHWPEKRFQGHHVRLLPRGNSCLTFFYGHCHFLESWWPRLV